MVESDIIVIAIQGRLDGRWDAVVVRKLPSGERERERWLDLVEEDVVALLRPSS